MNIKQWWKQLTCRHKWKLQRWHWTHGISAMEPRMAEVEMKCQICGKVEYIYPKRGSVEEDILVARHADKFD